MRKRDPEVLSDVVQLVTSPRELRPGVPYDRRRIEPSHIQAWLTMQTTRGPERAAIEHRVTADDLSVEASTHVRQDFR